MKLRSVLTAIMLTLAFAAFSQTGDSAKLEEVLKRMEAVGKKFRSFKAQLTQKKYTAVLDFYKFPSREFLAVQLNGTSCAGKGFVLSS